MVDDLIIMDKKRIFKEAKELINALRKGDVFYSNDALYKKGGYKYMPLKNARIRGFKTLEDREVLTLETITNYIIITLSDIDGLYNIKIKKKHELSLMCIFL